MASSRARSPQNEFGDCTAVRFTEGTSIPAMPPPKSILCHGKNNRSMNRRAAHPPRIQSGVRILLRSTHASRVDDHYDRLLPPRCVLITRAVNVVDPCSRTVFQLNDGRRAAKPERLGSRGCGSVSSCGLEYSRREAAPSSRPSSPTGCPWWWSSSTDPAAPTEIAAAAGVHGARHRATTPSARISTVAATAKRSSRHCTSTASISPSWPASARSSRSRSSMPSRACDQHASGAAAVVQGLARGA